ncbi:methyl-accepting chemotaxis protein [Tropicibacter sp. S64]|uniref:methyl-accepting chemotaxis protein n=1 Tax=Tropicibacter sp. S64 TaxID=3415122 RepID=UPI003C7E7B1C
MSVLILALAAVAGTSWVVEKRLTDNADRLSMYFAADDFMMHTELTLLEAEGKLLRYGSDVSETWNPIATRIDEVVTDLRTVSDQPWQTERLVQELGQIGELLGVISGLAEQARAATSVEERATVIETADHTLRNALFKLAALAELTDQATEELSAEVSRISNWAQVLILSVASVGLAGAVATALLFGKALSKAIHAIAASIRDLTEERFDGEIAGTDRKDELGGIAQNVSDLRNRLSEASRAARKESELNEGRVALFAVLGEAMTALKLGDLDQRLNSEEWSRLGEDYVKLCDDFNGLVVGIDDLVGQLRDSGDRVQGNAQELTRMSSEMARRSELQAATLEESAAALEELASSVQSAAERAKSAEAKVVTGRERAERGGEVMARAQSAMGSIAKSSEQITQIIGVIDDIAFQTNLLALNAGVEAARAGESGKGFAVVASEVRGLAQRASESASEIKELVSNSSDQVAAGERLVEETSVTLKDIVESVNEVSELVAEISASAQQQAQGVQEINVGVSELDKVTQQNAAMVNETTEASRELSGEADRLSGLLSEFSGGTGPAARVSGDVGAVEMFDEDDVVEPVVRDRPVSALGESDLEVEPEPLDTAGTWDEAEIKPSTPAPSVVRSKVAVNDEVGVWSDF